MFWITLEKFRLPSVQKYWRLSFTCHKRQRVELFFLLPLRTQANQLSLFIHRMSLTAIDAAITLISGCDLPCIQKNFTCATASKWWVIDLLFERKSFVLMVQELIWPFGKRKQMKSMLETRRESLFSSKKPGRHLTLMYLPASFGS